MLNAELPAFGIWHSSFVIRHSSFAIPMPSPLLLPVLLFSTLAYQPATAPATVMTLDVDATDAPLKILHATMTMAAKPGPATLFYPKWIPGEHMPSGPIANLTGLHIFADGKELDWRRDLVEMNAFGITVPIGAKNLTAKYDYVVPTGGGAFGSTPSTNATIAVINSAPGRLSPTGRNPDAIQGKARLKSPAAWKHGGSLDVDSGDGTTSRYSPTSLAGRDRHPVLL